MLHCASTTWSSPPCSDLQRDLAGEQSKTKLSEIIYSSNDLRIATCNIALVTFLALRNTPLAFVKAYSHEHLKPLYQAAGYYTVIFSLLYTTIFTTALSHSGSLTSLLEDQNIMGIVSGRSILLILSSALILRKSLYEAFLYHPHLSIHPHSHRRWNAPPRHHLEGSHYYHLLPPPSGLAIASSALP
jgi:hypothetical protein